MQWLECISQIRGKATKCFWMVFGSTKLTAGTMMIGVISWFEGAEP